MYKYVIGLYILYNKISSQSEGHLQRSTRQLEFVWREYLKEHIHILRQRKNIIFFSEENS